AQGRDPSRRRHPRKQRRAQASRRRASAARRQADRGSRNMTATSVEVRFTVNGEEVREIVEARKNLVDFLREDLGLTGTHVGCEHGVCGACTVRVNGEIVRGCLMLAVQCDGMTIETIEGVSDSGAIADLQEAFQQRNALQCGFCTPGMLLTAQALLRNGSVPSRE